MLESHVPDCLPQKEDIMQYYLEMLHEYIDSPAAAKTNAKPETATSQKNMISNDGAQTGNNSRNSASTMAASSSKTEGSSSTKAASAKKLKDNRQVAVNLEEASDL